MKMKSSKKKVEFDVTANDEGDDLDWEDVNDRVHSKMIDAVKSVGGQKHVTVRSEASGTVSEFDLSRGEQKISAAELIHRINDAKAKSMDLKKKVRKAVVANKVIPAPPPKALVEKVQRKVGYFKAKSEADQWEPIVKDNYLADELQFPLKKTDITIKAPKQLVSKIGTRSELEMEVYKVLNQSVSNDPEIKLTKEERQVMFVLKREEAMEKIRTMRQIRSQMQQEAAKNRRERKIKSKKYHRIKRREETRNKVKELKLLMKTNPDAANKILEEVEEKRMNERFTLRHKNTGRWARLQLMRANLDKDVKNAMREQVEQGKELTQKVRRNQDSESEDEAEKMVGDVEEERKKAEEEAVKKKGRLDEFFKSTNPWVKMGSSSSKTSGGTTTSGVGGGNKDAPSATAATFGEVTTTVNWDISTWRNPIRDAANRDKKKLDLVKATDSAQGSSAKHHVVGEDGDIKTAATVELNTVVVGVEDGRAIPDAMEDDVDDDVNENQRLTLAEAFADDDVISAFREEKESELGKNLPKEEPVMRGWGDWTGEGAVSSRPFKRKNFWVKNKRERPVKKRKDETLNHVIINPDADKAMDKHRPRIVPGVFQNADAYCGIMSHPVGRAWNTEASFKELTKPKFVTRMGTIIDPIDEEARLHVEKRDYSTSRKKEKRNCQDLQAVSR